MLYPPSGGYMPLCDPGILRQRAAPNLRVAHFMSERRHPSVSASSPTQRERSASVPNSRPSGDPNVGGAHRDIHWPLPANHWVPSVQISVLKHMTDRMTGLNCPEAGSLPALHRRELPRTAGRVYPVTQYNGVPSACQRQPVAVLQSTPKPVVVLLDLWPPGAPCRRCFGRGRWPRNTPGHP
jgi:hypothetical protein